VKICAYEAGGRQVAGILAADGAIIRADGADLVTALREGRRLAAAEGARPARGVRLTAPLARPGKIICAGVNYASHQQENPAAVLPDEPFFFAKLPSAIIGPDEPIVIPELSTQLDYEVELAAVIGRPIRNVSPEEALAAVFGYTIINDVSARDIQFKDNQIMLGKGLDTFCPIGPVVVTADEIPDPQDLIVSSYVNGQRRQHESTAGMVFPVADLLSRLSRHITLEPGDVVTTGTPAGVGCFMQPPGLLRPGDLVEVEVTGIGKLSNPVAGPAGSAPASAASAMGPG
jgi:2-keto-4-pentenoate hydratase/2-oxohepta-3-ene-1,7-dioic acid hydratase in catechol pathway